MRTSRLVTAGLALLLPLSFAACSGDDKDDNKESSEETTRAVDPSRVSPSDLPEVPELKKPKGAIADASFGDCATTAGDQTVTGTVTNSTKTASDYVVTVSWINQTSDVLARGVATVTGLAAGEEQEVEVTATVPDGADTCTFHVQRGSLS